MKPLKLTILTLLAATVLLTGCNDAGNDTSSSQAESNQIESTLDATSQYEESSIDESIPDNSSQPEETSEDTHVHSFVTRTVTTQATCTSEGEERYECACGEFVTETIPALPHKYDSSEILKATCQEDGYILYKCDCGNTQRETLPKKGHDFQQTLTQQATCTQDGYIIFTCHCGATNQEIVPKLAHNYSEVYEDTSTDPNEVTLVKRCACGEEIREPANNPEPHEHSFVEIQRVEATCTQSGSVTHKCDCGDMRIERIKAYGHNHKLTSSELSESESQFVNIYTCDACADCYTEIIPIQSPTIYKDMCGESLINQALPHDEYAELAQLMFACINNKYTADTATNDKRISLEGYDADDTLYWLRTRYRYVSIMYKHAVYKHTNKSPEMIFWGDESVWKEMDAVQAEVQRVLQELGIDESTTQYEAIELINDYVCESLWYDEDLTNRNSSVLFSMINESGVCHNYALRFQLLCLGAGIECEYYVSVPMNHAWNLVIFSDGTQAWVDTCWNDARYQFSDGRVVETSVQNGIPAEDVKKLRSRYLLIDTDTLLNDHVL